MSLLEAKNLILAQTPLASLIGETITLQKQSGKLVGCCPFHGEKTGSFYIYHDHFHCFGCGAHGDAITFVRKKYGLGFIPALRWLAEKYAIAVSALEQSADDLTKLKSQAQQGKILLAAQQFFVSHLWRDEGRHHEGQDARAYLKDRGFDEDACRSYGFGLAPNGEHALHQHMRALGFHDDELEQASLITKYNERTFDFFRHRLIVPIHDGYGRIIAFGGRTLGGATQKYKNSRYNKGSILFAMHRARQAMGQKGRALVVEGYFDALQLHLHGFTETVACQGTALTQEHLQQLNAGTKQVYLVFDGDSPGRQAALKIITLALNFPDLQFRVVELPRDEDPDALVRRGGSEALQSLIDSADDLIYFAIQSKLRGAAPTAIPHLINDEFIPWLASIPQAIKQSFLCRKISELSGVSEGIISQELAAYGKRQSKNSPTAGPTTVTVTPTRRATFPSTGSLAAPTLPPLAYELIGQLYFAGPNEIAVTQVKEFVERELQIEEVWLYFIDELLQSLGAGQTPSERELGSWHSSQNNNVIKLLGTLAQTQAAFRCSERPRQIERIQLMYQQQKVKEGLAGLKRQLLLPEDSVSEQREASRRTLQEIADLNKKLYNIAALLQNS